MQTKASTAWFTSNFFNRAELAIDTAHDRDAQAAFERSQKFAKEG